jgi:hypothetical protein
LCEKARQGVCEVEFIALNDEIPLLQDQVAIREQTDERKESSLYHLDELMMRRGTGFTDGAI